VPAAAVIPAPEAYINIVAVKKLVVGFLINRSDPQLSSGECRNVVFHPFRELCLLLTEQDTVI
jgi:hypothetical protein